MTGNLRYRWQPNGWRQCRACNRLAQAKYREHT